MCNYTRHVIPKLELSTGESRQTHIRNKSSPQLPGKWGPTSNYHIFEGPVQNISQGPKDFRARSKKDQALSFGKKCEVSKSCRKSELRWTKLNTVGAAKVNLDVLGLDPLPVGILLRSPCLIAAFRNR